MKRKTLELMNVGSEGILSRDEMKHIMAGSGGNNCAQAPCSDAAIACCCGNPPTAVTCVDTLQECVDFCGSA